MKYVVTFILAVLVSVAQAEVKDTVKYVFLFIGDGMGFSHREMTELYLKNQKQEGLRMLKFPIQGVMTTHAANASITDSSASGTAIACGVKTNKGCVGLDVEGNRLTSIAETARDVGKRVGIVSSMYLNDATPASFYGHQTYRKKYYELSMDMLASEFDYFAGGMVSDADGEKCDSSKGNVLELAKQQGYTVARTSDEIRRLDNLPAIVIPELLQDDEVYYALDNAEEANRLAQMTRKGIELLDSEAGFFMMVEGAKIDRASHFNDVVTLVNEMIAFDQAIEEAYQFAQKHPEETLIVVISDHETGGLSLGSEHAQSGYDFQWFGTQVGSYQEFGKAIAAQATQAGVFSYEYTIPLIQKYYGLKPIREEGKDVGILYSKELEWMQRELGTASGEMTYSISSDKQLKYQVNTLTGTLNRILSGRIGVAWGTYYHTAQPVPVSATGKFSEKFGNRFDNTDIALKLRPLLF